MSIRAHYAADLSLDHEQFLRDRLVNEVDLSVGKTPPDDVDLDLLVSGRPQRPWLARTGRLLIPWSGLPQATADLLVDFPQVAVHNIHHNARPVAEMALALLLAAGRRIIPADRALRQGDWRPRYERPWTGRLWRGKRALVLGYGAIGRELARLCVGMGMHTTAVRRSVAAVQQDGPVTIYPSTALQNLWPQADAVLVCVPHTPHTEGLIDADALSRMGDHTVLVNIARAAVIDEAALYEALADNRLYGAGLDVWYAYPGGEAARTDTFPGNYPFHELDSVVLSPHRAGHVAETEELRLTAVAEMLNTSAAGKPLPHRVDVEAGY